MIEVDNLPEFTNTPASLSRNEKQNYLNKRMNTFVSKHFNIDKQGKIKDIKARGTDVAIENEAPRVVKLLPKFIAIKHRNRKEEYSYSLPIIFEVVN